MSDPDLETLARRARTSLQAAAQASPLPNSPVEEFGRRRRQRNSVRSAALAGVAILGGIVAYQATDESDTRVVADAPSTGTTVAPTPPAPTADLRGNDCFMASDLPEGWEPALLPGPAYDGGPSFKTDQTHAAHWAGPGRFLSPGPQEGYIDVASEITEPGWPETWPQTEEVSVLDGGATFGLLTFGPENKYWAVFPACGRWWVLSTGGLEEAAFKRVLAGLTYTGR